MINYAGWYKSTRLGVQQLSAEFNLPILDERRLTPSMIAEVVIDVLNSGLG
jgi:hypothetical protein